MADEIRKTLSGRVDSNNAAEVEQALTKGLRQDGSERLVLDLAELRYLSSAGLRVLLHLQKNCAGLRLINVSTDIYDILDMTGFTQMMEVERVLRSISIRGCEEIGHGANGSVYRISQDTVAKVYRSGAGLEEIRHEREMARLALILGIPTAISYEVVRADGLYATVFELLNARSFSSIIAKEPERLDWCIREFTALLRKIHGTVAPAGKLPDMRQTALGWVEEMRGHLPQAAWEKLRALTAAVPDDPHLIHGDYHTKNLELQGDEVLLIDMDTLAHGHPIFELCSIYNSFLGFYETDPEGIRQFQGFSIDTARAFWQRFLARYLQTQCPDKLREVEDKARVLGYTRLIRRAIGRGDHRGEAGARAVAHWTEELLELLDRTETLVFSPDELVLPALAENLEQVQTFVAERLGERCGMKAQMQLDLAVEEIFINIASYAYAPGQGNVSVTVRLEQEPPTAVVCFRDRGVPYDPLAKEDPDVNALAQERKVGGLGIFLTKQVMDQVHYEYREGQNVLTMKKRL